MAEKLSYRRDGNFVTSKVTSWSRCEPLRNLLPALFPDLFPDPLTNPYSGPRPNPLCDPSRDQNPRKDVEFKKGKDPLGSSLDQILSRLDPREIAELYIELYRRQIAELLDELYLVDEPISQFDRMGQDQLTELKLERSWWELIKRVLGSLIELMH